MSGDTHYEDRPRPQASTPWGGILAAFLALALVGTVIYFTVIRGTPPTASAEATHLVAAEKAAPLPVVEPTVRTCAIGAEVESRQNTADAIRVREALEDHLADLFCNIPSTDASFHPRPAEVTWTYGDNTPITGQVSTRFGDMRWKPARQQIQ